MPPKIPQQTTQQAITKTQWTENNNAQAETSSTNPNYYIKQVWMHSSSQQLVAIVVGIDGLVSDNGGTCAI